MQVDLPVEIQLRIVDQIADFNLWYRARFVCQAWLARILVEQDTKVWDFVKFRDNAFLLPNGVKHGTTVTFHGNYGISLLLYRYGKQFGTRDIFDNDLMNGFILFSTYSNSIYCEYNSLDIFPTITFNTGKSDIGFKLYIEGLFEYYIITESYKSSFSLPSGKFGFIEYNNQPAVHSGIDYDYLSDNDSTSI